MRKTCVSCVRPESAPLSKLSDVVKNDVAKIDVHNTKIRKIEDKIPDITNLATNTTLNAKINEVKNEIPSVNVATTDALDAKINDVKAKIPSITNLATTTALTAVGNRIPSISKLVEKTVYDIKISEIENKLSTDHDHEKCITTQ